MNYYNKYTLIDVSKSSFPIFSGKLEKKDDIFYVNDIEVENNRGIILDIVHVNKKTNEVINIQERNKKSIPGILQLQSKMKYGVKNNKSIYLFKPCNKQYPYFYVCSSSKAQKQVYALIEFKSWETNEKQPFGTIIEILGPIGQKENDLKALLYYYDLFHKQQKANPLELQTHQQMIENISLKDIEYSIFCIDPIGSMDLDDGFHYQSHEDYEEIGIHIAYPYKFLSSSSLVTELFQRVCTLYVCPNIDLISSKYATNLCSFLKNQNRYALSLILKIKDNQLIDYRIKETIVHVQHNYHYDQFDELISNYQQNYKKDKHEHAYLSFLRTTKAFFKLEKIDSHSLVENWMIFMNKTMASLLIKNPILNNVIVRVHRSKYDYEKQIEHKQENKEEHKQENKEEDKQENKEEKEQFLHYMHYLDEQSASYEIYDVSKEQGHSKMDNCLYTHFTSPMRRCVDFFNQALFINHKNLYDQTELQKHINFINMYEKRLKKFYRKQRRLEFIYSHQGNNQTLHTSGYISKIGDNYIRVYIPQFHLDEKVVLFHHKVKNIISIEKNETSISYIYEQNKYYYQLYQKINIELFILSQEENLMEKIKIMIV